MEPRHSIFMRRALVLAQKGRLGAHPNPCVGCVIVKNGRVIGEGYHSHFGGPHAEVNALKRAGKKAKNADVYLTLEPCSHWGKTPPCAPLLIQSGIKRLFVAMKDPNPEVSGRGLRAVRESGIQTRVGLEAASASLLNRSFVTAMTQKRPRVILKMAMTIDGKTATKTGASHWISGSESRLLVHRMRAESDAVLVGRGTAEADNPALTSHGQGRNPLRIVLDPRLRTPIRSQIFNTSASSTLVVVGPKSAASKRKFLQRKGVKILRLDMKNGSFELTKLLNYLFKNSVHQLLIEGGEDTAWRFLEAGLVDEICFFVAPLILGGRTAKTPIGGRGFDEIRLARSLKDWTVSKVGKDFMIKGLVHP